MIFTIGWVTHALLRGPLATDPYLHTGYCCRSPGLAVRLRVALDPGRAPRGPMWAPERTGEPGQDSGYRPLPADRLIWWGHDRVTDAAAKRSAEQGELTALVGGTWTGPT